MEEKTVLAPHPFHVYRSSFSRHEEKYWDIFPHILSISLSFFRSSFLSSPYLSFVCCCSSSFLSKLTPCRSVRGEWYSGGLKIPRQLLPGFTPLPKNCLFESFEWKESVFVWFNSRKDILTAVSFTLPLSLKDVF